jgi:hypothetical protein
MATERLVHEGRLASKLADAEEKARLAGVGASTPHLRFHGGYHLKFYSTGWVDLRREAA